MENKSRQEKVFAELFNYSKRLFAYSWFNSLFRFFVLPLSVILLLIYVDRLFNVFADKAVSYLIIFIFVVVNAWLGGLIPNEIRKLKKREKLYAKAFTDLHIAYDKAQGEIKARDEFLSMASHELKTPLTSMLLKLSSMLNTIRSVSLSRFSVAELMGVLENSQLQIKQLTTMINDLLNVSLMTTGKLNLVKSKTDLVKITSLVKENFSETLKHQGYRVDVQTDGPIVGNWDRSRLEQAITNLFSNAIKYGLNKPIEIKIVNNKTHARFIIKDQGIGISPKDKKILFQPFERPKSVDGFKKGLGVGLYLTSQIVKAHGGSIKVFSAPRKGSTFVMELPIV